MSIEGTARRLLLEKGCTLDVYKDSDVSRIEDDLRKAFYHTESIQDNETGEVYSLFDIAQEIMEISTIASSMFNPVYKCVGIETSTFGTINTIYCGKETEFPTIAMDDAMKKYKELIDERNLLSLEEWNKKVDSIEFFVVFGERNEEEREIYWKCYKEDLHELGWHKRVNHEA